MARTLYFDRSRGTLNRLVQSRGQLVPASLGELVVGDNEPLRIVLVGRNLPQNLDPDSGNATITPKVAIGECGGPEGGTYKLDGFGPETEFDFNESIETFKTKIDTVTGADPIRVRGVAGNVYQIEWEQPIVPLTLGSVNELTPASVVSIDQIQAFDESENLNEIWIVRLNRVPLAFSDNFTPFDETTNGGDRGWEGELSIAEIEMYKAIFAGEGSIESTFELELSGSIGPETVAKQSVTVRCEIIPSGVSTQPFAGPTLNQTAIQALIDDSITALNLGTMSQLPANALSEGFVLQASGTGLDPDIDGVRFFDTGEVQSGEPVYRSEPVTGLDVDGTPVAFVTIQNSNGPWFIVVFDALNNVLTEFAPLGSSLLGDYEPNAPFAAGIVTISSTIPQKRTTLGIVTGSDELDFPSIDSNSTETETITVEGAITGAACFAGPPANWPQDLRYNVAVTATDTVQIKAFNKSGSAINPPAGTWQVVVFNPF